MSPVPRVLAVITARGGSKGVPRKNVVPLGGKPLIAWTIDAAHQSEHLTRVIVSTDDEEIADVARRHGADVPFMRPPELAADTSHHPDVMVHAVEFMANEFGESFDMVMCLQPTVPFRTADHIDEGIVRFKHSGAQSLISLKKQDYPPWWMFRIEDERIAAAFEYEPGVNVFNLERQQLPRVYRPNGAIYLTTTAALIKWHRLVDPDDCACFVMDEGASVDIDTFADFAMAEAMLKMAPLSGL